MNQSSKDKAQEMRNRQAAAKFLCERYSREERFLLIYERDLSKYVSAFTADKFKSEDKREMLRWDFFACFNSFKKMMKECKWSKKFLASYGIDFVAVRNLFFATFTAEEIARWS